jgi:hypothetical protein
MWFMPTIVPTSLDLRPSAFNSIVWQRFRKVWLSLFLYKFSNSVRSDSLRIGVFTRHMNTNLLNNINYLV